MPKQTVPDMEFKYFTIGELPAHFSSNSITINSEYQRSDIWSDDQKIALIESISNRYSIGVLVLFVNSDGKYEILDGQQRLLAIRNYIEGVLDLTDTKLTKYGDLPTPEKNLFDAYCVFYLRLKSFDDSTIEEEVTQTFLRLQEGTPLNKAEKINAYRGVFKDTFRDIRATHQIFTLLGEDSRFRFRLLAAEFLLLELEGDFKNKVFPGLDLQSFKEAIETYKDGVSKERLYF